MIRWTPSRSTTVNINEIHISSHNCKLPCNLNHAVEMDCCYSLQPTPDRILFTIQLVLVTDGETSFAAFLYEESDDPALIELMSTHIGFLAGDGIKMANIPSVSLGAVVVFRINGMIVWKSKLSRKFCNNMIMLVGDCITLLRPEQVEVPADMCACSDVQASTLCPAG